MDFEEFSRPEWQLLSQVSRPSRYAGSEWRPYPKADWKDAKLRVCLTCCVCPETEAIMRSHDMPLRSIDIAPGLVASVAAEGVNNHGF
ncbi:MAG: hypothetical protein IJS28_02555 [Synergistaceae bacterium]|nr:hypothetical protein [Synergistaceae bacterium]